MLFKKKHSIDSIRKNIVGINKKAMLRNGKMASYINFDNAASTPTFVPVLNKVNEFLEWYSSIHRGSGYKSMISTKVYDKCHNIVARFVNCDPQKNVVIFVKNATEAINKLSYRLQLTKNDVVLTTLMEHHSNDLPWRHKGHLIHVGLNKDGSLDMNDLKKKLQLNFGRVKLVAVTGCSNVTGIVNDIHAIASLAHTYNAKILVDGAQLVPHRKINMKGYEDDDYIDFLVFSGHKLYAPFGTGALIGPKETFVKGEPEYVGGGTIISVTQHNSFWANLPEKDEAGTPNVVGAVALCEAIKVIEEIGMDNIKSHEKKLTNHLIDGLKHIPNLTLYTPLDETKDIVGVVSFKIEDFNHNILASLLSYEGGIGVRNGCFCAHPYIHKLLNLSSKDISKLQQQLIMGDLTNTPGLVRISFGVYNNEAEVNSFLDTLNYIVKNEKSLLANYKYNQETGEYAPVLLPSSFLNDFTV